MTLDANTTTALATVLGIVGTVVALKHPLLGAGLSALAARLAGKAKPAAPPATPPEDLVELAHVPAGELSDRELLDRLNADLAEVHARRALWEQMLTWTQPPAVKP